MAIKNLKTGEISFQGTVLYTYEQYQGCDRYVGYAEVWTGSAIGSVQIWSAYCDMTEYTHSAVVDATPEVRQAVEAWKHEQACIEAEKRAAEYRAERARAKAEVEALQAMFDATPARGSKVVVTNNRSGKAKKGETGEVFWKGVNKFDPNKISVGITLHDGRKIYLNANAVKAA